MLALEVAGKDYQFKQWKDLTLKEAVKIEQLKIPDKLRTYYKEMIERKQPLWNMTVEDVTRDFPEYYGEVISLLTDIPDEILKKINAIDRTDFFDNYCRGMVLDLVARLPETYYAEGITSFKFKDTEYLLPKDLKILEMTLPADSATALEFVESSDIMVAWSKLEKGFDAIALVIAVYCHPEGEVYDTKKVAQRAKEFQDLTMDVVWEIFFYISKLLASYQNIIRYMKQKQIDDLRAKAITPSDGQDLGITVTRRGYMKSRTKRITRTKKSKR
jgi:hypothetical protein